MHLPVMPEEVLRLLNVSRGGLYVDCTLGLGGHAVAGLGKLQEVAQLFADLRAAGFASEHDFMPKSLQPVGEQPNLGGLAAAFAAFK